MNKKHSAQLSLLMLQMTYEKSCIEEWWYSQTLIGIFHEVRGTVPNTEVSDDDRFYDMIQLLTEE